MYPTTLWAIGAVALAPGTAQAQSCAEFGFVCPPPVVASTSGTGNGGGNSANAPGHNKAAVTPPPPPPPPPVISTPTIVGAGTGGPTAIAGLPAVSAGFLQQVGLLIGEQSALQPGTVARFLDILEDTLQGKPSIDTPYSSGDVILHLDTNIIQANGTGTHQPPVF